MSYVVQQPNSLTNPTGSYRVVRYEDWVNWEGKVLSALPVIASFSNYWEAERRRDELNNPT